MSLSDFACLLLRFVNCEFHRLAVVGLCACRSSVIKILNDDLAKVLEKIILMVKISLQGRSDV